MLILWYIDLLCYNLICIDHLPLLAGTALLSYLVYLTQIKNLLFVSFFVEKQCCRKTRDLFGRLDVIKKKKIIIVMSTYLDVLKDYILSIYNSSNATLEIQQQIFEELKRLSFKLSELNELIGNIPIKFS